MSGPIVQMQAICKDFGQVRVLRNVDFTLEQGEIHGLIGENGAGKSTLMKILAGIEQPTEGRILLDGEPVRLPDTFAAESRGIVLIHQEFNLADHLTAEENIFLGREMFWKRTPFLDKARMRDQARQYLAELDCHIDPQRRIRDLPVSDRQMVEIAKALSRNARVLIMDEPTAVLTPQEGEALFRLMRKLKANGVSIVYISHKLGEVKTITDRITVLRDGERVADHDTADVDQDQMATLMVGRDLQDMYPEKHPPAADAETVLDVEGLSADGGIRDVSFSLKRGEILGFAGLLGAGRTEVMEALVSLRRRQAGIIRLHGTERRFKRMRDAVDAGIVYLTEDRKGKGLLTQMPMLPNLTLLALRKFCRPLIDTRAEREALFRAIDTYEIRAGSQDVLVSMLSGGNQQKLALAKIMEAEPEIIILDEPTRGIDVGTKRQVYFFIKELAEQGKAVIIVSSELPEVIGISHRVAVMHDGRLTGILEGDAITEDEIVRYATGLKSEPKPQESQELRHGLGA